ncbi:unnamed protein product [Vitrella brassicaformis CCMP3155]|uniref:Uncharacterized protein n=1 Tax=Vitrella brassicaformis (strain CCMP3155) TaxID=1169540 RepID=A0A0G4EFC0_VITBC|nr:unnamed protein product [Vitrella brassicaformis CCMP3155]|eukprot:CEL94122.1 unnamed protein product [Vitrella brassicaformis CCMP3155]
MGQSSSAASEGPHTQAVPPGCRTLDDVDIIPDEGVSPVSQRLLEGCIRRAFTHQDQLTQLIRQGADPGAIGGLRVRGATRPPLFRYSCLPFAIDCPSNYPFLYASGAYGSLMSVALPQWSSRQLQGDIINALIDGGAAVNAGGGEDLGVDRPIRAAVAAGNLTALQTLLARQANVRGFLAMELPHIHGAAPSATREYEAALILVYRRLAQHDSTLAAERFGGMNLVYSAALRPSAFSQQFIDAYLDLITSHGAEFAATDHSGGTPLHMAAACAFPCVADWLCRQLTAEDINRGKPNQPNETPLAAAAFVLDRFIRQDGEGQQRSRRIRECKTTIRTLLKGGAAPSTSRMPNATEEQRRRRQLVLSEYATVLNQLSEVVISAINAALAPQRDHSTLLARLLPLAPHHDGAHPHPSPSNMAFGPHEAEGIGWKIGAFLHEPSAAGAAIDEYLIFDTGLKRRVKAAVDHFVKSAATQTSGNREAVGETRYEQQGDKRVKVTVPPLQCFAIRAAGNGGQVVGVREVVHRARLDEAAQHGVVGVIKGFNEHLGDQDCQFEWGQLGRLLRTGLFVSLGID